MPRPVRTLDEQAPGGSLARRHGVHEGCEGAGQASAVGLIAGEHLEGMQGIRGIGGIETWTSME